MPFKEKEYLLPCPFCGGTDLDIYFDDWWGDWFVFCEHCETKTVHFLSKEAVIKKWNTRVKIK